MIDSETYRTFVFPHVEAGFSAIVVPIALEEN